MPDYEITDAKTGRTLVVRGDSPPTEQEMVELFEGERRGAYQQSRERIGEYLGETAGNVGGDIAGTLGNMVYGAADLMGTAAGAAREAIGLDQERGDIDKLKGIVPGIIEHYAGYLDPEERALRVREHPVGTALDLVPIAGALSRVPARAIARAAPGAAATGTAATLRGAAKVARPASAVAGTVPGIVTGSPETALGGFALGWSQGPKVAETLEGWADRIRPRGPRAGAATETVAPTAESLATVDQWLRDIIAKRDPAAWEGSPYAPPRRPTDGSPGPPGAPPAPAPPSGPPPPSTPPAPAGEPIIADEILKRERAAAADTSWLDAEFDKLRQQQQKVRTSTEPTPQDYIKRGAVSTKAKERKNLGTEAERVLSYDEWTELEKRARDAGDFEQADYYNKRARQRLHISKNEERRRARRGK